MGRLGTWAAMLGLAVAAAGAVPAGAQDDRAYLGTSLFGEYVPGGGAGEDASGDFTAEIDLKAGRMCYFLEVEGLDEVTAAHIHEGARGKDGPPVVTLELVGEDGDDVCVNVDPALLRRIVRDQAKFYINVHTAEFPDGAVRGQLKE